ncbi:MAG: hypothetical protein ABI120_14410, partial [Gemmatimonadaceae bacterium]
MKSSLSSLIKAAISTQSPKRLGVVAAYSALGGLSIMIGVAVACAPLAPIVPRPTSGNAPVNAPAGAPASAPASSPGAVASKPAGASPRPTTKGERSGVLGGRDRMAWIALAGKMPVAKVSATGAWQVS